MKCMSQFSFWCSLGYYVTYTSRSYDCTGSESSLSECRSVAGSCGVGFDISREERAAFVAIICGATVSLPLLCPKWLSLISLTIMYVASFGTTKLVGWKCHCHSSQCVLVPSRGHRAWQLCVQLPGDPCKPQYWCGEDHNHFEQTSFHGGVQLSHS